MAPTVPHKMRQLQYSQSSAQAPGGRNKRADDSKMHYPADIGKDTAYDKQVVDLKAQKSF